ncbi:MAG TPA: Mur ligase family protein [Gaiellaceae bacterium]
MRSSSATGASSTQSATDWVASLSPWPADGFGLERMQALLDRLGHPERWYDAIHVVGTKGKSTAARTIAALLATEGLTTAAYTSPHVAGWEERLDTDATGFERAVARVRGAAEAVDATQFEILTAAAFADFAERGIEVAVVEAGLGGRLDATNVVDAKVVLLTNIGLEHTEVLGHTRELIAREKLAVAKPGAVVVLHDREFAPLVRENEILLGGAREAAAAYLGRPVEAEVRVELAGRFERRGTEVRDGAHTPEAAEWLLERLPEPHDYVVVASVLGDKDVEALLERFARAGKTLVATRSSNDRALPASVVAEHGRRVFGEVLEVPEPRAALARARELGRPVLVTGSLYLLADLSKEE